METPRALQDLDLAGLIGLPVERARAVVEATGGVLRAVAPGTAVTLEYRADRVTVLVVNGEVIETGGIG
jgi:hypothetical protein